MARNASGVYSLPAGNPVVTLTTITSSWANTTMDDLKTEMTDSLSRSGKGGMLAVLGLVDGAVGAPALTFSSDPDTGLFRAAANELGLTTGGTERLRISSAGADVTGRVSATAMEFTSAPHGPNWSTADASRESLRRSAGIVVWSFDMVAAAGASWSDLGTLPAGFRPPHLVSLMCHIFDSSATQTTPAIAEITAAGVLSITKWLNPGTVTFLAPPAIGVGDQAGPVTVTFSI